MYAYHRSEYVSLLFPRRARRVCVEAIIGERAAAERARRSALGGDVTQKIQACIFNEFRRRAARVRVCGRVAFRMYAPCRFSRSRRQYQTRAADSSLSLFTLTLLESHDSGLLLRRNNKQLQRERTGLTCVFRKHSVLLTKMLMKSLTLHRTLVP